MTQASQTAALEAYGRRFTRSIVYTVEVTYDDAGRVCVSPAYLKG